MTIVYTVMFHLLPFDLTVIVIVFCCHLVTPLKAMKMLFFNITYIK
jgi:hypothetical protein